MKIGIFGGTFNPIHIGHQFAGEISRIALDIDKMYVIPSSLPPHKSQPSVSGRERLSMVKIAYSDDCAYTVLDYEVSKDELSYSYYTIEYIKSLHRQSEIITILGEDAFFDIDKWHRFEEIGELTSFACMRRSTKDLSYFDYFSSSIKTSHGINSCFVDIPFLDISSSYIRNRVSKGLSIKYLVPKGVDCFIEENKLYKSS